MSMAAGPTGFEALRALVESQSDFRAVADKDWSAAAGLIVKKLLNAAGQSATSLTALRSAVGHEIFDAQLKTLSHHQAKLLARRLDKTVPDLEVSTARAAIAHIRTLLAPVPSGAPVVTQTAPPTEEALPEPENVTEPPADDTPPPATPNPYFGRKSFRAG